MPNHLQAYGAGAEYDMEFFLRIPSAGSGTSIDAALSAGAVAHRTSAGTAAANSAR